jgi:8-oxo-dGTP pyrophosphatase MutT (NUDIX family)
MRIVGGTRALAMRSGYRLALAGLRAWWVIRRSRSDGVRCVLRNADAFVLVRHSYGDAGWMLPGGRVRRPENPLQAAEREMRQELGLTATGWRELGYLAPRDAYWRDSRAQPYRRHGTYYFTADVDSPALAPRAAELVDAGWFTLAGLPSGRSPALDIAIERGWLDRPT